MIIVVDIGNTTVSFGFIANNKLIYMFKIPTNKTAGLSYYRKEFINKTHKKLLKEKAGMVLIVSVVPSVTKHVANALSEYSKTKPKIIGSDVIVPLKNCCKPPKKVGQDRLVTAYAAAKLYGVPAIVVDFGTAITFDYVSKNHEYCGGIIVPGIETALNALVDRTELLPKIKIKNPIELIGTDTESAMQSGIVFGFSCLADGIIELIKKRIKPKAVCVATGGGLAIIERYCKQLDIKDPDLIMRGLMIINNKLQN